MILTYFYQIIYNDKNLETKVNEELAKVHSWLCANRLSLNIDKTNLLYFIHPQKR